MGQRSKQGLDVCRGYYLEEFVRRVILQPSYLACRIVECNSFVCAELNDSFLVETFLALDFKMMPVEWRANWW